MHVSVKDDFADDLAEEILTEAAHTLFSRRVQLDSEIDAFSQATAEVRKQMHRTLCLAETMHKIVIEPERLYSALGVEPKGLLTAGARHGPMEPLEVPLRLTVRSRYVALAKSLYSQLAAETEKYNHGEIYRDPETTLLKRTTHYKELMEWHQELSSQIVTQNRNRPSYSLQLAKCLNADLCDKERVMKPYAWGSNGSDVDQKLAFQDIPFSSTGLAEMPVLPPVRKIRTRLHGFLNEAYDRHQGKIHQILRDMHM